MCRAEPPKKADGMARYKRPENVYQKIIEENKNVEQEIEECVVVINNGPVTHL